MNFPGSEKLTLALAALLLATGFDQAPRSQWSVIVAEDGTVIGHVSERVGGTETTSEQRLTVQEPGDPATEIVERTTTRTDAAGRIVSVSQYRQTGRSWTRTEARVHSDRVETSRQTSASPRQSFTVNLPANTRFDGGRGLLPGWDPAAEPQLTFANYSFDAGTVERVVIEPAGTTLSAAGRRALLRRRYDGDSLRGVQLLIVDDRGKVVESRQPMFGTTVTIRPATQSEALAPRKPYRPLARALVRSPFRLPDAALQGRIRYRFTFRDGIAFPLPDTPEQRASVSAEGATLEICANCGTGAGSDEPGREDALRSTAWLQSDHPRLRRLASPARRQGVSDVRKMELLVRVAQEQLPDIDFAGHFTALDALARRRGDCTESAVLLAALGRAAGIPTKVASGLVYSRARYHGMSNVFLPHSWVLAYVGGRWRSFDAALGEFDASHIALVIGDGDARSIAAANQLAGLIVWQDMREVRRRETP
jgi:hypothetical protein